MIWITFLDPAVHENSTVVDASVPKLTLCAKAEFTPPPPRKNCEGGGEGREGNASFHIRRIG